jgi:hypothetical protein
LTIFDSFEKLPFAVTKPHMKKTKLQIEYKVAFVLYVIVIVGILGFIGCQTTKSYQKKQEQKQIEKEVEEMLDFPAIAQNIRVQI